MASGGDDLGDREHQEEAWVVRVRDDAVLCAVCGAKDNLTAVIHVVGEMRHAVDQGS